MANVTISALNIGFPWPSTWGTSGILKVISDREFVSSGKPYPAGRNSDPINQNFCYQAAITVVSGVATVGAIVLPQTDATDIQVVNGSGTPLYTGIIYSNGGNTKRQVLFQGYFISSSLGLTFNFAAWANNCNAPTAINPRSTWVDTDTLNRALLAVAYAPASTTQLGLVTLDINPVDSAIPEVVGSNSYATTAHTGIGKSSVTRSPTSDVTFVEISDPILLDFFNIESYGALTSNTAAQNATAIALAVTAAAIAGTGIFVPAGTFLCNTVSISVPIQFANGTSILSAPTGQTISYTKSITADQSQHFAGLGTHSFSTDTSIPTFYPQWRGVTGNGSTDDTIAMQKFLDEMQSGFHVTLTPRLNIRNTGLTLGPIQKLVIEALGGNNTDTGNMARFSYRGTNGGTHLHFTSCHGCQFVGFGINDRAGGAVTDGPDTSIWLDQDGSGNISSNNILKDLTIDGPNRSSYNPLKIDNVSGTNNEHHIIDHVYAISYGYFLGYGLEVGTGIYLGHGNVKEIMIRNSAIIGFAKGVRGVGNPSFYSENNNYTSTAIAWSGAFGDVCTSLFDHSEGTTQIVNGIFVGFNMAGAGERWDDLRGGQAVSGATSAAPVFNIAGANLNISGNEFLSHGTFTSDFILNTSLGNGNLTWRQNKVAVISVANLSTGLDSFLYSNDDVRGIAAIRGALTFVGTNVTLAGATPNVSVGSTGAQYSVRYGFTNGGTPTTVTDFLNGFNGQILIIVGDVVTSIANGAAIKTVSGGTIAPWSADKVVVLYLDSTVWRQIGGQLDLTSFGSITASNVTDSALTSGRVVVAGTAGLLSDDADLTFAIDTLTGTKLAATTAMTISAAGKLSTVPKTSDTWGAAISLDVTISSHDIAAVFGTSATCTITPTAAGSAGDWLFINTINGAGGSVVVTFASTFHSSGTQTTQASRYSSIAFRSTGLVWVEQYRTTDLT